MDRSAKTVERPYGMTIDQRKKAVITGVTEVESFDESTVVLHTHGGRLTLCGSGLHVSSLQIEDGKLAVEGAIDSAAYESGGRRRGGFFRRALG